MAILISPSREDLTVSGRDSTTGFTKDEMDGLIGADSKAFRLQTGALLLVGSLACLAKPEERNIAATRLLRNAIGDPGGEVCGCALMLAPDESACLSSAVQAALPLRSEDSRRVLLLDRDDGIRRVIALGLEKNACCVVQARTVAESLRFCQEYSIDLLVADVSSLRPQPLEARQSIQEVQTQAVVLLISGYDQLRITEWYPGLLTGVQFLQKPFPLGRLRTLLNQMRRTQRSRGQPLFLVHGETNSEG